MTNDWGQLLQKLLNGSLVYAHEHCDTRTHTLKLHILSAKCIHMLAFAEMLTWMKR